MKLLYPSHFHVTIGNFIRMDCLRCKKAFASEESNLMLVEIFEKDGEDVTIDKLKKGSLESLKMVQMSLVMMIREVRENDALFTFDSAKELKGIPSLWTTLVSIVRC